MTCQRRHAKDGAAGVRHRGAVSLAGALTYAEIAAMMPHAGGDTFFSARSVWTTLGLSLWLDVLLIGKAGSQAGALVLALRFFQRVLGGSLSGQYFSANLFSYKIHSVIAGRGAAAIVIVTLINARR